MWFDHDRVTFLTKKISEKAKPPKLFIGFGGSMPIAQIKICHLSPPNFPKSDVQYFYRFGILGASNGKKWSKIWNFLFWSGLKSPRIFFFCWFCFTKHGGNHASRWIRDLWLKGVSLILAHQKIWFLGILDPPYCGHHRQRPLIKNPLNQNHVSKTASTARGHSSRTPQTRTTCIRRPAPPEVPLQGHPPSVSGLYQARDPSLPPYS